MDKVIKLFNESKKKANRPQDQMDVIFLEKKKEMNLL